MLLGGANGCDFVLVVLQFDDGWWRTFNPRGITKDAEWEIIIILLGYCLGAMKGPRLDLRFVNFHLFIAAASASASVSVTVCFIV